MNEQNKPNVDLINVRNGVCIGILVFLATVAALAIVSCEVGDPAQPDQDAELRSVPSDGVIGDPAYSDPFVTVPKIDTNIVEPDLGSFEPVPLPTPATSEPIMPESCDGMGFLCDENASCIDTDRGYQCICKVGFDGDGDLFGTGCTLVPEKDVDACRGKKLGWSTGRGHGVDDSSHNAKHGCDR